MRLSETASVGPFFALRTDDDAGADAHGFLPLGEEAVRLRVATVAERLGTADRRVAASIAFQGVAGRLLSVPLASAVLTGSVPDLADGRLRWHPGATAPDDLLLPRPAALPPTAEPAAQIAATVLHGLLAPLMDVTRTVTPVSPRLLRGNAASSLAGSLRVLHTWCGARGRHREAAHAVAVARSLLTDPLLHDTGTLRTGGAPSFTRRSCCLYYRVPGGGLCGDCVLRGR
ncbi:(2Fe-2S)-binding protein [Streptomyces cinnamoneus]|uniref:(2Fe-2S)-binding protein n=1 Tax=Streptomyces cinnamoneus TaxID=53446 RepID=UPI0037AE162B